MVKDYIPFLGMESFKHLSFPTSQTHLVNHDPSAEGQNFKANPSLRKCSLLK